MTRSRIKFRSYRTRSRASPGTRNRLLPSLLLLAIALLMRRTLSPNTRPHVNLQLDTAKRLLYQCQNFPDQSYKNMSCLDRNEDLSTNIALSNHFNNTTLQRIGLKINPRKTLPRKSESKNIDLPVLFLILILAGDIHPNPGPRATNAAQIYPCGLCDRPVTWSNDGICCDECNIWLHRTCVSMSFSEYSLLARSNVQWACHRCHTLNLASFTFSPIKLTNSFSPLNEITEDDVSTEMTLPTTSSPKKLRTFRPSFNLSSIETVEAGVKLNSHRNHKPNSPTPSYTSLSNTTPTSPPLPQTTLCTLHPLPKSPQANSAKPYETPPEPQTAMKYDMSTRSSTYLSDHQSTDPEKSTESGNETDSPLVQDTNTDMPLTKLSDLRIVNFNAQCIRGKTCQLKAMVKNCKPDIICCTETWLYGKKPGANHEEKAYLDSELGLPDYQIYRNDRDINGGGVFIAIKKTLISLEEPKYVTNCEVIWAKVRLRGCKELIVGCFYMPHRNLPDIQELDLSLKRITKNNFKHIVLCGDFNCRHINWDCLTIDPSAKEREVQQELLDVTVNHGLKQCVTGSTRQNSLLDLYFTTIPMLVQKSFTSPGISDHDLVITDSTVKPQTIKFTRREILLTKKANWPQIKEDCIQTSKAIKQMYEDEGNDVNDLWSYLKEAIQKTVKENIPSKTINNRNSVPWMTRHLKSMISKKARLHKRAKISGNWTHYRAVQKECKKAFRKAEARYIKNQINEGLEKKDLKPFWRYIKSKKTDCTGSISPLLKDGELETNNKSKAEILLHQFCSVFTKPVDGNKTKGMPQVHKRIRKSLMNIKIEEKGIEKLLQNVNVSKACGPDNIPNCILKECSNELTPAISRIFQASLDSGKLPKDWKTANVTPIFKKGERSNPANYRPVSLTSVLSKLLEHVICKAMLNHFDKNKVLNGVNHGFRSGYSCETQLAVTLNDLTLYHDNGLQTDIAILDFSKAFDTVPHDKLLYKLEAYGIRGNLLDWIGAFLCERSMRVIINGDQSSETAVLSGVPQGTVLGPLLFLCHINDLPDQVVSKVRLFADDCLLYRTIKGRDDHMKLQEDLKKLEEWSEDWGMRFNPSKCYILSSAPKNKSMSFYQLCGTILQEVQNNPYLGLNISNDLSWNHHINKICKKANSTLAFVRRNMWHCPKQTRLLAYKSLVRPHLEYGATIWDPFLKYNIEKIEKIQRQAARFIKKDFKSREPGCVTKMMKDLDLDPLEQRRKTLRLSLLYKINEGLLPAIPPEEYLNPVKDRRKIKSKTFDGFVTNNPISKYETNHSKCFILPPVNNPGGPYKHSFFVKTIIDWNKLNEEAVTASSLEEFKKLIH